MARILLKTLLGTTATIVTVLFTLPVIFFFIFEYTDLNSSDLTLSSENLTVNDNTDSISMEDDINDTNNETLSCYNGFFKVEGKCVPHCKNFHISPYPYTLFVNVCQSVVGATCIGTMIILGVYSIKERKKLIKFPSIFSLFILFNVGLAGVAECFANFLGPSLFCKFDNLLETQSADPTIACILAGAIHHYTLTCSTVWWIMYLSILVFRVSHPFKAQQLRTNKNRTLIFWLLTITGFLLPLPAVILSLTADSYHYRIAGFPPHTCSPPEGLRFYSVVLPVNVFLAVGICFVCYVVWMFNKLQGSSSTGSTAFALAERKLFVLLVIYLVAGIYAIIFSVIVRSNTDRFSVELANYFQCESTGYSPGKCSTNAFQTWANTSLVLNGILNLLFALLPPAGIVSFVFNWQSCAKFFKERKHTKAIEN